MGPAKSAKAPVPKLGCVLVLLLPLVGLGVAWCSRRDRMAGETSTPAGNAGAPFDSAVQEQQRKLLDEQSLAVQEQTRLLYEQRIELRRQRIQLIADRLELEGHREYDRISLVNRCPHDIAVALDYLDLDDKWIVRGWWNLKPDEEVLTDAYTRNAKIYFYAENLAEGWKWDGSNREGSRELGVVDARFDRLENEASVYQDLRAVSFYQVETGTEWTTHSEVFECNPEAREATPPR